MNAEPLLDAATLDRLAGLGVAQLARAVTGFGGGVGPAGAPGAETVDHRPYVPGDDLRRIDANVFARLHQRVVRLAPSEAQVGVAVLVDASGSVEGELRAVLRVAALLGAVALLSGDIAQPVALRDGDALPGPRLAGPRALPELLAWLDDVHAGGTTTLASSVTRARRAVGDAPLAVLVTDGLVPAADLAAAAADLHAVVHVTAAPDLPAGPLDLVDAETGERLPVQLDARTRAAYAARAEAHATALRRACLRAGVEYASTTPSADPFTLLTDLADRGTLLTRSTR